MTNKQTNKKTQTNKQTKPVIRNFYTSDLTHPGTECPGESLTHQSFADECDINKIMAKFAKTGTVTHLNADQPNYGLATSIDFKEAMDTVTGSLDAFQDIPSEIRALFDNDPAAFLEFAENPDNIPEMARMGLLTDEATHRLLEPENASETLSEPPAAPPKATPEPTTESQHS